MTSMLDVASFVRRMERHASETENSARLSCIMDAVPVVVPDQYISTSPEPVDHPGVWPPFPNTLFLSQLMNGTVCGALVSIVSEALSPDDKEALCDLLSGIGKREVTNPNNIELPTTEKTVWQASKLVKVLHVLGVSEDTNVFANTFWLANESRIWTNIAYSVASSDPWLGDAVRPWINASCAVALAAMDLLACKNVRLAVGSEAVSRQRRRRGYAGISWRTIAVSGKGSVSTSGTPINIGDLPRLHECRGHFKEYNEHPLFGKYSGRFFWHPYLRGDIKHGAVIHDKYELLARP